MGTRFLTARDYIEADKHAELMDEIVLEAQRRVRNRTMNRIAREFAAAIHRRRLNSVPRLFFGQPVWYGIPK